LNGSLRFSSTGHVLQKVRVSTALINVLTASKEVASTYGLYDDGFNTMFLTFSLDLLSGFDTIEVVDGNVTTVRGEGSGEEFADAAILKSAQATKYRRSNRWCRSNIRYVGCH
jgi:hypothetical protein